MPSGQRQLQHRGDQWEAGEDVVRVRTRRRSAVQLSAALRACGPNRKLARAVHVVPDDRAAAPQRGRAASDRSDRINADMPDLAQGADNRQCLLPPRASPNSPDGELIAGYLPSGALIAFDPASRKQSGWNRGAQQRPPPALAGRARRRRDDLLVAAAHRSAPTTPCRRVCPAPSLRPSPWIFDD